MKTGKWVAVIRYTSAFGTSRRDRAGPFDSREEAITWWRDTIGYPGSATVDIHEEVLPTLPIVAEQNRQANELAAEYRRADEADAARQAATGDVDEGQS